MRTHEWRIGPVPVADGFDCHRGLRGPYTGTGSMLRALVPRIHRDLPGLVTAHTIEILSLAPELRELCGAPVETLTSLASPAERTRIYPANRTRRLAHGVVELLNGYQTGRQSAPIELIFDRVDQADHTDQEFLSILVRRADPARIKVVVRSPHESVSDELAEALGRYARRTVATASGAPAGSRTEQALLRAFIDSDGTSADPAELAAYHAAEPGQRAALHDERARLLAARDERSLWFGAIPYHLEHGTDPTGAGVDALYEATRHCGAMGFYHMVIELGSRGRDLVDPDKYMERYWLLSTRVSSARLVLGRSVEGEVTYHELRRRYTLPDLHISTGYALAMVYTRVHPPELKDNDLAREYINNSIALASQLPDPEERAFHTVFQENGLALVEMHAGRLAEALRLVDEGAKRLDRELPPGKHMLHRSVLVHNRGKAHMALGHLPEALADMDRVVELDPNYPDYYFDRAEVRRRMGDIAGALADCDTAISISPPFYELHYNRADLRAEAGDIAGAIDDFGYVVELEPDQLDARVNVASLLLEQGEPGRARRYVDEGLHLHPGDPRLLCLRAQQAAETGDALAALCDYDRALAADPAMIAALAGRAAMAYDQGRYQDAVADLRAASALDPDDEDLRLNLDIALEASGELRV